MPSTEITYSERKYRIAREWFCKGREATDEFDKFIALWIAFNALYCSDGGEWSQISNFITENYHEEFDSVLEDISFFYRTIKNLHPAEYAPRNTKKMVRILKDPDATSIEKLKQLLNCIYIARCNLFHGEKALEYDDKDIAKHSGDILEKYLTIYFSIKHKS